MKKTSFLLSGSFFIGILVFGTAVFAQINVGDFEAYENGDLNDQNGWSDSWNPPQVQDELAFDGIKAIKNQEDFETAGYKELPEGFFENGIISAKIRIDKNDFSDNQQLFGIFKGIGEEYIALFRFANKFNGYDNTILFSKAGSTDTMTLGEITQGEWHKLSLGWRRSDFKIRVKIDNEEWTPWFDSQTTWQENESFGMRVTLPPSLDYGDFYLDDFKYFIGNEEPYYDPLLLVEETKTSETPDEIVETPEETPLVTETETDLSQTAAVSEADSGIVDTVVETLLDIIGVDDTAEETPIPETSTESNVEEAPAPSSVTGDTNTNGTTTTEF